MGSTLGWTLLALAGAAAKARAASHAVALVGVAGVVAVLIGVLAAAEGFRRALVGGADADTAIVLRAGATSELVSVMRGEAARIVEALPEWREGSRAAAVSTELFLVVPVARVDGTGELSLTLRGVGSGAAQVRRRFRIVAGRPLSPGRRELLVGVGAQRSLGGLGVGDPVVVAGESWPVVGVFATGGREDSEVWGDAPLLQSLFRRGDTVQAVYAKVADAATLARVRTRLRDDPRLSVDVHLQSDFYARQAEPFARVIKRLALLLCTVMGAAAGLSAVDAMYASVQTRATEISTLRALGFSRGSLFVSLLAESLLVSLAGGAIGAALAYAWVDGWRATTFDFRGLSQVAFRFTVTAALVAQGVGLAALLGAVGGAASAWSTLRAPVARGLHR